MRQAILIVLIIAALVSASVNAYVWVNSFVLSMYGYRSPVQDAPPLSADRTTPLTEQVVLVLVDGLRYDTSLQMPYLNSLRPHGAQAKLLASPPSTTQTAWVTLISGAGPEVNDMPLFERTADLLQPLTIDHLFAAVRRAGLSVGIAGFQWWEKLVPPDSLDLKYYADAEDDAADIRVVDRAVVFIEQFRPNFLLVNLRQVQEAGQTFGGTSVEYQQAALRCDDSIHRLAAAMDLQHSVLVVCSSHGYLAAERNAAVKLPRFVGELVPAAAGGYGGNEAVVLNTPLVIAGKGVTPGDYGTLSPSDLAPLIATLLGAPIPSAAQGHLPTHMLPLEIKDKAEKLLALAQQRLRIGNIYLYSIGKGTLTQAAEGDMLVAQSSIAVENYESAAELAALSTEQTDREITQARRSRLWAERVARAPAVAAAVLVPLLLAWLRRSKRLAWNVLAALLAAGLYHALFLGQKGVYSFSRIPAGGLAATLDPSLRRAALSLAVGGLLVALWMWRERQRSLFEVIRSSYAYTLALLYWIGLPIAACAWWSGLRFTWYIPNFTVAFVQFAVLEQAMLTAALAIVLPLPVLILQRVLLALSDWRMRAGRQAGLSARRNKEA
jgi:hypothetical protein